MLRVGSFLLAVTLIVAACTAKPIYNADNRQIAFSAQQFPLDRIESLIVQAGQKRNWKFTREAAGHLVATQVEPKHSATVDIYFDQKTYRIAYRSSVGLEEKNGTIHRTYNNWVHYLERDIDSTFANAQLVGPGRS